MGDRRFQDPYRRVKEAALPSEEIRRLSDEDVIAALAAAASENDPLASNVLATAAQNRVTLYAAILSNMAEGVFAVGPHGRVTALNDAAQFILGWSLAETHGKDMDAILGCTVADPDGIARQHAVCAQTLSRRQTTREDEALFTRRDGTRVYVSYTAAPILREDEVQGAVVVFRDITARRAAEANVRRLAAIVEASDDAVLSLGLDGTILTWNPRAEEMYGYSAANAIGKRATLIVPFELRADFEALLARVSRGEVLRHHLTKRMQRGGKVLDIALTATAIRNEDGRPIAVSWIARDITEARQREEQLRASDHRYRLLLDSVTDHAIFTLDPEGHVTSWNPAAQKIKGWKEEEIVGRHYSVLFPPEELKNRDPWTELEDAKRDGVHSGVERRMRKDGTLFDASVTLSAMHDKDGQLVGFVKVTRDVSERKAWERRLLTSEERYRALFEMFASPTLWCDAEGNVAAANAALLERLGFDSEDVIGRILGSLADPSDRNRVRDAVAAMKEGVPKELRFTLVGRHGRTATLPWRLLPVVVQDMTTGFFAVANGSREPDR